MLFNSPEFILAFLPLVVVVYWLLWPAGPAARNLLLLAASFFFYAWWDVRFLPLLLVSIAINYTVARLMFARPAHRHLMLSVAVAVNLGGLVYFKYAVFIVEALNAVSGASIATPETALPIGISFFTFTQIAYLVDASRGAAVRSSPLDYSLFVTFFPHLVAGPILHHAEVMPQFDGVRRRDLGRHCALGLTLFAVGLFKKAVLADSMAPLAEPVFAAFDAGGVTSGVQAWIGALAYTFQIYFDFSGYSDMAVGLAWLFGIRFPVNFFSPYQATSIVDFWRRWHITLSRFLRDYLYIPLGGNRRGTPRRYANLAVTMLLGGLWHGASWNFAIWGGLHGLYLVVNHAASGVLIAAVGMRGARVLGWMLTFLAVAFAWVCFRATTLSGAAGMMMAMLGIDGIHSESVAAAHGDLRVVLASLVLLTTMCVGAPNVYQMLDDYEVGILQAAIPRGGGDVCRWKPTFAAGLWYGALLVVGLCFVFFASVDSPFLYFQF